MGERGGLRMPLGRSKDEPLFCCEGFYVTVNRVFPRASVARSSLVDRKAGKKKDKRAQRRSVFLQTQSISHAEAGDGNAIIKCVRRLGKYCRLDHHFLVLLQGPLCNVACLCKTWNVIP